MGKCPEKNPYLCKYTYLYISHTHTYIFKNTTLDQGQRELGIQKCLKSYEFWHLGLSNLLLICLLNNSNYRCYSRLSDSNLWTFNLFLTQLPKKGIGHMWFLNRARDSNKYKAYHPHTGCTSIEASYKPQLTLKLCYLPQRATSEWLWWPSLLNVVSGAILWVSALAGRICVIPLLLQVWSVLKSVEVI